MSRQPMDRLGKLQRAVLETVWEMGEATVRHVWERLCPGKEVSYTTILAAMQRLEKSGWLRHRAEGKTNVYRPTRTREQAGLNSVRTFVERMFDGNALLMFRHLVEEGGLSDEELQELQRLIDKKRKERPK
ncbi:MAG: BlaI/MecI/CopY family transcriptional regulator [Sedimentisphaerales bacterium]|nr:BlaI/MecI/CopY family transcriptional regulator [Sedimentisphaerales bacterium]